MVVAVCPDEDSNDVYRGRVENVRYDDGNVQIFLVDFGVSEKIHWSQIYKLADQFLQVPEAVSSWTLISTYFYLSHEKVVQQGL